MAINVDKYALNSCKLVGMLLPYLLHGKKVLKFLSGIVSPLDDGNVAFCAWASERICDAVTTSQPVVLRWSLDERFRKYFQNSDDHFVIIPYEVGGLLIYEDQVELSATENSGTAWLPDDRTDTSVENKDDEAIIVEYGEVIRNSDTFTIISPPKNSKVGKDEYERRIRQVVKTYLVYDASYNIFIRNEE